MSEATLTYCANHPDRETSLRCNNCGKLICTQCAVHTPTGYRCKECVRGQAKKFDTAQVQDYVLGFIVALILSYMGGVIASFTGFFTILIAPAAGGIIAEAVRAVTGRRRSMLLFRSVLVGVVLGAAPFILLPLLGLLSGNAGSLLRILWPAVYLFFAAPTAYYRLSGIQLGR